MTLNDIANLIRIAKVPRSKTVEMLYPNPSCAVHVPASHLAIVGEVLNRMTLPGQNIRAVLLESRDVGPSEHLYVKVKDGMQFEPRRPDEPLAYYRSRQRAVNSHVVVECATVVA